MDQNTNHSERASLSAHADAAVVTTSGVRERGALHGLYAAELLRVKPGCERKFEPLWAHRNALEFSINNAPLLRRWVPALLGKRLRRMRELTKEMRQYQYVAWQETFENAVATVGKNLALDTFLAGSAYTVVGPYLGLISSVSHVNLATTISSLTSYATNVVTLVTAASHGLTAGDTFTIASATGTGTNFAVVNGTWVAAGGSSGTTLVFSIGAAGLTITTLTGGNVTTTSGTRVNDTMASHGNWTEAGNANAPTYTAPRKTAAWSSAASGSKALSAALSFAITGSGTVKGAFLVYGSGAVTTIDNTSGTLMSAGTFTGGDKVVANTDTLNVSYSLAF